MGDANEANLALEQLSLSDRILLNKTDLISDEHYMDVSQLLKTINPSATYIKSQRCQVPISLLLDVNSFSLDRALDLDAAFLPSSQAPSG